MKNKHLKKGVVLLLSVAIMSILSGCVDQSQGKKIYQILL